MKNKDILRLSKGFQQVSELRGAKFAYSIARNTDIIKPIVESLEKTLAYDEGYTLYETERVALAMKHSKKSETGDPVIENNRYIVEKQNKFNEDFKKLNEKHKETLIARENQIREYNKIMEEESEPIELRKVKSDDLPSDIPAFSLTQIIEMIED